MCKHSLADKLRLGLFHIICRIMISMLGSFHLGKRCKNSKNWFVSSTYVRINFQIKPSKYKFILIKNYCEDLGYIKVFYLTTDSRTVVITGGFCHSPAMLEQYLLR